jgi:hypothetical protein
MPEATHLVELQHHICVSHAEVGPDVRAGMDDQR